MQRQSPTGSEILGELINQLSKINRDLKNISPEPPKKVISILAETQQSILTMLYHFANSKTNLTKIAGYPSPVQKIFQHILENPKISYADIKKIADQEKILDTKLSWGLFKKKQKHLLQEKLATQLTAMPFLSAISESNMSDLRKALLSLDGLTMGNAQKFTVKL